MSRTKNAKDKKPRKKRKLYAGKPIRKKRKYKGFVRYVSTRKKDAAIKLWFWEERPMNKNSYRNFSKQTRKFMRKIIYKPTLRLDIPPEMISTTELVEQLCLDQLWAGTWLVMGFSHGKNKYGIKPVKLCKIRITEHPDGLRAKMITNYRLFRYSWFFSK